MSSFFYLSSFSQTATLPAGCVQLTADEMVWTDTLKSLPKGTQFCSLYGNIKKEGPFAIRLKLLPNQVLKTHYHANDEVVTVLEGSISVGFNDQDPSAVKTFTAGSFYVNAAKIEHYTVVGPEGATIQINSLGPWTITFK